MSKRECVKFGYAIGNGPSMATHYEVFKQIKQQSKLILEEVNELEEASSDEDMQEIVDACMNIKFLNTYLEHLLEAYGCNVKKAWETVCENNLQKTTNSFAYVQSSKEYLESREDGEYYIDELTFEGELLYTVKRVSDNKVMKLKSHIRPDLSVCIPEEFKV